MTLKKKVVSCFFINECDEEVQKIKQNRTKNYKVNRNVTLGLLKNKIVLLFWEQDPQAILELLKTKFVQHLVDIKPNRSFSHRYRNVKRKGKYRTIQNYRRAI